MCKLYGFYNFCVWLVIFCSVFMKHGFSATFKKSELCFHEISLLMIIILQIIIIIYYNNNLSYV